VAGDELDPESVQELPHGPVVPAEHMIDREATLEVLRLEEL
jgi:hypothetical protein